MKTLPIVAVTSALFATAAFAGGMAEPIAIMDPEVIEQAASSSSAGLIIPLILLALIALALSTPEPVYLPSDTRLKTDIERVGIASNGLPLYHFRYHGQPTLFEGVMAQDVLEHTPAAVAEMSNGYYAVNYAMIGVEMRVVH